MRSSFADAQPRAKSWPWPRCCQILGGKKTTTKLHTASLRGSHGASCPPSQRCMAQEQGDCMMKISTGPANVGNFQGNSPLEPEPPAISTAFSPRKLLASDCPAFIYTSTLIILTKDLVSRQSLLIYQTAKITCKYTSSLLYLLCVY